MPNSASAFSSEYLSAERMSTAVSSMAGVFGELLGDCLLIARYEWGANLHADLCYRDMGVPCRTLSYFIEDSVSQRIIVPGQSDLVLETGGKSLVVKLCHESDIHVDGNDLSLMQRFMQHKHFGDIRWYSQDEVKQMWP